MKVSVSGWICRIAGVAGLSFAAASLIGGGVWAGEPSAAPLRLANATGQPLQAARDDALRTAPRQRSGFLSSRLLPRLNRQFVSLTPYQAMPDRGAALADFVLRDQLNDSARDQAESVTRKTVEDYLLDTTGVGQFVQRVSEQSLGQLLNRISDKTSIQPGERARQGRSRRPTMELEVGISHGVPTLELSSPVGQGAFKANISPLGLVELEYQQGRKARTWMYGKYDVGEGLLDLGCRVRW
jgi:hypothetical protein